MSRHNQQHLSASPNLLYQNQNQNQAQNLLENSNFQNTTVLDHSYNIIDQPRSSNILSPPIIPPIPIRRESYSSSSNNQDYHHGNQLPSILPIIPPTRAPSLFQPPPPREDTGYRLESKGRIPAIRIPPVPYQRRDSNQSLTGEGSSTFYDQQPLLPPINSSSSSSTTSNLGLTSDYHSSNHNRHRLSIGQLSPSSNPHSQSRSPYGSSQFYNLALASASQSQPGSSGSRSYSIERGLRSPHPPLTAGLHQHPQQNYLWPLHSHNTLPLPSLHSSPHTHSYTHSHSHSLSHSKSPQPQSQTHHRDSIGSSGRPYYTTTNTNDLLPSIPGPSTSTSSQIHHRESPYLNCDSSVSTSYLPSINPHPPAHTQPHTYSHLHSHSHSIAGFTRPQSPVHIPPPLRFKYSISPPKYLSQEDNQHQQYIDNNMPPRKKATGDTSLVGGSSTPRTMSSATNVTGGGGSVTRSGRKSANGKGWTMEHTYDSIGQKKEIIVIDDSQSPMTHSHNSSQQSFHQQQQPLLNPLRKRTRAQVAAEQAQAQALSQSQNSIYNHGTVNGHGHGSSTTSLNSSQTKKRKVDENSEHGSAKKTKGKLASTATSASVQAIGTSYASQQYMAQPKTTQQYQKAQPSATLQSAQTSTQPPWDDAEGHYIVKPDDVIGGRYKIVRLLGQGTFGKVVEARHIETRKKVAIKVIRAVQKYRDASKIEIRVLETLKKHDSRNDNKCIHLDEYFDFRNHPCLVSELYGMSVFDFLKQNGFQPFPEKHIQDFARSLLRSVAFLHNLKLVHTDLKPENILLCSNESRLQGPRTKGAKSKSILRNTEIRLIDFGSATFETEYHSSVVSTRHYRAPEIILGLPWSYPCDMFSIGCILVEFYTGDALFQTHDNLEHLAMMEVVMGKFSARMIEKGRYKKPEFFRGSKIDFPNATVSKASKKYVKGMRNLKDIIAPTTKHQNLFLDLCVRLLEHDPDVRIKVQDALRHPYLTEPIPEPA
ncbi:uncharacterized protein L201_007273 [Kwoniella dendrophila CBS 6074]|uniref:Protein kinase domain-containing protein n=1 Tax=Kwoniella dendrophila CBS 6074 TaxID=1295534 RepID=A0AAX4K599_9TREE